MIQCSFCSESLLDKFALANHVRWYHKRKELEKLCLFCDRAFDPANYERHTLCCQRQNPCRNCGNLTRNDDFCSKKCSAILNNKLHLTGFAAYRRKKNIKAQQTYRDVCFEIWKQKCAIPECGWDVSVDVHHIDGDHHNDQIGNLIPLCRNHHQMTEILQYRDEMKQRCCELVMTKLVV